MASRKAEDMHPWLQERYAAACKVWKEKYPNGPTPFLTCTFRSNEEQNGLYAQGRTKPGSKVTNARGGQSLHNYHPSYAFDMAFKDNAGKVLWDLKWYREFAVIMKSYGTAWGGDWKSIRDNPHFEVPNFTASQAAKGQKPNLPDIPTDRCPL